MDIELVNQTQRALEQIESGKATPDQVLLALHFKKRLSEAVRGLGYAIEQAAIAWIEQNGEIEQGAARYYVGETRKYKCRSVESVLREALEKEGIEGLLMFLSTQPFKAATTAKQFPALFDCEVVKEVETGKPRKMLKQAQTGALDEE